MDATGNATGPFSKGQLALWRPALPMDLPVWKQKESSSGGPLPAEERDTVDLAVVVGDGLLLEQWRECNPDQASK
jgi:hypothetical protein